MIYYDWKYVLEVDFANDVSKVKDAYLQYQGFKVADDPILLEWATSRPSTLSSRNQRSLRR